MCSDGVEILKFVRAEFCTGSTSYFRCYMHLYYVVTIMASGTDNRTWYVRVTLRITKHVAGEVGERGEQQSHCRINARTWTRTIKMQL
jgi:hypothetical protein